MRRGWILVFLAVVAGAIGAEPIHNPLASMSAVRPLPERYSILTSRSIFARDGIAVAPPPIDGATAGLAGWTTGGTEPALRGVVLKDGVYTAIVEDPANHRTQNLEVGANIADGRILRISLQGLDYLAGGRVVSVAVGQDLTGRYAIATTRPMAEAEKPAQENAAAPAGPAGTPVPEVAVDGGSARSSPPGRSPAD